eukprot:CAMPEP_0115024332 /NCGR_PEP_ID=MMETSP0216-20121206/33133_1 /TAXON_ID=223996 /ORGANISM="Protocruzia adherens, Strain Boccale" /LENGTH=500 /DNA_ID=CAMNT_0002398287 /DNA_START=145 /DNA_END=1647 /DNA_ORIENTATION=-
MSPSSGLSSGPYTSSPYGADTEGGKLGLTLEKGERQLQRLHERYSPINKTYNGFLNHDQGIFRDEEEDEIEADENEGNNFGFDSRQRINTFPDPLTPPDEKKRAFTPTLPITNSARQTNEPAIIHTGASSYRGNSQAPTITSSRQRIVVAHQNDLSSHRAATNRPVPTSAQSTTKRHLLRQPNDNTNLSLTPKILTLDSNSNVKNYYENSRLNQSNVTTAVQRHHGGGGGSHISDFDVGQGDDVSVGVPAKRLRSVVVDSDLVDDDDVIGGGEKTVYEQILADKFGGKSNRGGGRGNGKKGRVRSKKEIQEDDFKERLEELYQVEHQVFLEFIKKRESFLVMMHGRFYAERGHEWQELYKLFQLWDELDVAYRRRLPFFKVTEVERKIKREIEELMWDLKDRGDELNLIRKRENLKEKMELCRTDFERRGLIKEFKEISEKLVKALEKWKVENRRDLEWKGVSYLDIIKNDKAFQDRDVKDKLRQEVAARYNNKKKRGWN